MPLDCCCAACRPAASLPGVPTNVSAFYALAVSWNPPDSDGGDPITGYTVQCQNPSNDYVIGPELFPGANTTYGIMPDVEPGVPLQCSVAAVNAVGQGGTSDLSDQLITGGGDCGGGVLRQPPPPPDSPPPPPEYYYSPPPYNPYPNPPPYPTYYYSPPPPPLRYGSP